MRTRLTEVSLWLVVLVATSLRWSRALSNPAHTVDFAPVFQASGKLLHGGTMYASDGYGYVYLPSAALIFAPLRVLSLADAAATSMLLGLVSLSLACWLIVRRLGGPEWIAPASALILVLCEQTLTDLIFGNVDLWIPVLVALTAVTWDRRRSAIAYGLTIAIKPLIAVPALLGLATRRYRWILITSAVIALLCLPGLLLTDVSRFFSDTLPFLASGEKDEIIQVQSIALDSVLRHDLDQSLRLVLRVIALAASALVATAAWRRPTPATLRFLEATAAGQVGLALANGFTLPHHALTVLLLLPSIAHRSALARGPGVLASLLWVASPLTLPIWSVQAQQAAGSCLLLSLLAIRLGRPK